MTRQFQLSTWLRFCFIIGSLHACEMGLSHRSGQHICLKENRIMILWYSKATQPVCELYRNHKVCVMMPDSLLFFAILRLCGPLPVVCPNHSHYLITNKICFVFLNSIFVWSTFFWQPLYKIEGPFIPKSNVSLAAEASEEIPADSNKQQIVRHRTDGAHFYKVCTSAKGKSNIGNFAKKRGLWVILQRKPVQMRGS